MEEEKLKELRNRISEKNYKVPVWRDYDQCCNILQEGVPAIKFNFSNNITKQVVLRLSQDRK
jgi:hypothetical protein